MLLTRADVLSVVVPLLVLRTWSVRGYVNRTSHVHNTGVVVHPNPGGLTGTTPPLYRYSYSLSGGEGSFVLFSLSSETPSRLSRDVCGTRLGTRQSLCPVLVRRYVPRMSLTQDSRFVNDCDVNADSYLTHLLLPHP